MFGCAESEIQFDPNNHACSARALASPTLAHFVVRAMSVTGYPPRISFLAVFLLCRLKQTFPYTQGRCGRRLFLSAFMIAGKVICGDTYSNKFWCVAGQRMVSLRKIN